ncbi:MAG: polyribonucleotide nucleotidyltransferase, partial [Chitinophagaceae bacterium]
MLTQPIKSVINLGASAPISLETGRLARQADGSVTVTQGNCVLLATVCANKQAKEGQDFFPLSVDYMEKFASAGRIPGSFFKREGKLNDYEVLISRLIDRALRPLFPEDYYCEVQVIVTLISSDEEILPDALACLAASAALAVSDIPIKEIISEVRIGRVDGEFIVNPTRSQMAISDVNFIIGATEKNLMMVEGEAKECTEEELIKALEIAHDAIRLQITAQHELRAKVGVEGKRDYAKPVINTELHDKVSSFAKDKIHQISSSASAKNERSEAYDKVKEELVVSLGDEATDDLKKLAKKYFEDLKWEVVRDMILDQRIRLDGRKLDDIRSLNMEVDILPSPHGSALFTRGETQSVTTVTLGTPLDELLIESAQTSEYSKFILHYNFPPFSTGEIKFLRGPGRREVGHGNLAQRSLKQMMPGNEYPYTVRVVSDILESNGSSSMATVCAGSLALMDAGVPVPKHVSGIAMGLITRADGKYAILSDILGDEDHLGDMDFKVTGTRDGICGVQMDIKVDGLSMNTMREALDQAKRGRHHILDHMYQAIDRYRDEVKPHAPRMEKLFIEKEFIGAVIGPGGKIIQEIQRETGTTINLEEVGNQGEVSIFSKDKEGLVKAVNWVKGIVAVPEIGEVYESKVKSVMPYGAFVEFMPGKQGLLHISEVSWKRLETMEGVLSEGEMVKVKLIGLDPKTGKFKLSRKVLMPKPEGYEERPPRENREPREQREPRDFKPRHDRNRNEGPKEEG